MATTLKVMSEQKRTRYSAEYRAEALALATRRVFSKEDVLFRFLERVVESEALHIHPSISIDMGAKYCASKGCCLKWFDSGLTRYRFVAESLLLSRRFCDEWDRLVAGIIGVLPGNIWQQIVWRERRIGEFLDVEHFKFDSQPVVTGDHFKQRWSILVNDFNTYWTKARKHRLLRASIFIASKGFDVLRRIKRKIGRLPGRLAAGRKGVVLGRVACLGKEVFHMHPNGERKNVLVNQQKMRVDLWGDLMRGARPCRPELIKMYLARRDIYPFLAEQANIPWLKHDDVQYVLMDSFSELTDQLFVHKRERWAFCSHHSDIEHSPEFEGEFECRGLLSLERMEQSYREYFDWFVTAYPNTPVIFINFPAALDGRDVFKRRAEEIGRVIDLIAREYDCIHVLSVDASDVVHAVGDSFPYHFGKITNMAFITKWGRVLEH